MRELTGGLALEKLPFVLEHVQDLVEYEGPIVSEFKSADGEPYVYYFCEQDEELSRWLVVRTLRTDLVRYKAGIRSLRQLLRECPDRLAYICDIDSDGFTKRVRVSPLAAVPNEYYPRSDELVAVGDDGQRQNLLLDGANGYDIVTKLPREYLQPYGFAAMFGPNGDPSALGLLDYNLESNCGWVFHMVFERMARRHHTRALVDAVQFASPGYITFSVDAACAEDLREIVKRYVYGGRDLRTTCKSLREWTNSKSRETTREHGLRLLTAVGKLLAVNVDELKSRTKDLRDATKLLSGFVSRVRKLAVNHVTGKAVIVGLELDGAKQDTFARSIKKSPSHSIDVGGDPPDEDEDD
jgi:hypothetical protein